MDRIYKISTLRIIDKYKFIDSLTEEQREIAIEKYNNKFNQFTIKVSYENGIFILKDNPDLFYAAINLNEHMINVILVDKDEEYIVDKLLIRAKKEVLNPMLAAYIYGEIKEFSGYSQDYIAKKIGKTQGAISNKSRLLSLPRFVQNELIKGNIKERHGRAILKLSKHDEYENESKIVLDKIIKEDMLVNETEDLIDEFLGKAVGKRESLNIIALGDKNQLKQKEIKMVIKEIDLDLDVLQKKLKKHFPNLIFKVEQGTVKEDYVFLIKMKGVNK